MDIVEHRLGSTREGLGQTFHDITILDGHYIRFQSCASSQQMLKSQAAWRSVLGDPGFRPDDRLFSGLM